jgi:hypothetical protein
MYKKILLTFFLSIFLFAASASFAADPAGWWTSSSGSSVHIWANMQQLVITVKTANGLQYKYNGWWTRFGETFAYTVPGTGNYAAGFDRKSRNVIHVQAPNGTYYKWSRYTKQAAKQKTKKSNTVILDGLWSSTSGSSVQISTKGNQIFVNFVSAKGQRFQGSGRWLKYGYQFDYSIPGYNGVAICTVNSQNANYIHVNYNGTKSTWQKTR